MSGLRITKWESQNLSSPGWMSVHGLEEVLADPLLVAPEYFNESIYSDYLYNLLILMDYTTQYPGFVSYRGFRDTHEIFYTVTEFDNVQLATNFEDYLSNNPIYDADFIPARTALLNLLGVVMTIYPVKDSAISLEQLTVGDIKSLL